MSIAPHTKLATGGWLAFTRGSVRAARALARVLIVSASMIGGVGAADIRSDPKFTFDIPRQPAHEALGAFARQAGITALFPIDAASRFMTNAVAGRYTRQQALDLMLAGTGLKGRIDRQAYLVLDKNSLSARQPARGEGLLRRIGTALAGFAGAVQSARREAALSERVEEVTVTGTRLRVREGMEMPTPVTAIQAREIDVLAPGNIVEAMNQLPQFLNNSGPSNIGSATGPLGSSFLNLRGVGSNRTLVLLDGRRVAASNRLGVTDIAMFPEAMIRGVEVVTGGASAAYGSDAVSGVVNFMLDTDYTGLRSRAQVGMTDREDNEGFEASISGGRDIGERGHFIASLELFRANRIESYADRGWYRNWGSVDVNGPGQPSVVAADVRSRLYTAGGLIRLPGSRLDMTHFLTGGVPARFEDGTLIGATRQVGGTGFYGDVASKEEDQSGQGSLYPDVRRAAVFVYADYDFGEHWNGYLQYIHGTNTIGYMTTGTHQETAAWRATIFRDNAFLSEQVRQIMIEEGRDSFPLYRYSSKLDLSRARGEQDNELDSYTIGIKGSAGDVHIHGYYQYGRSTSLYLATDWARLDRLYRAMDAVRHPVSGAIVCRSTLSLPDDGCVPANPFGAGTMSRAAVEYILEGDMYRESLLQQHFAEITADREILGDRAAGPISFAGGLSYRDDSFRVHSGPAELVALDVPPAAEQGYAGLPPSFVGSTLQQFSGIVDEPLGGGFDVWEAFAEALVPLLKGRSPVRSLDFNGAVRYAHYAGSGGVLAWKAGLDWSITSSMRLRATRSRDTRAATLAERFDSSLAGATGLDPLQNRTYSFRQLIGGNPVVDPELGDTWTVGIVLHPSLLPRLALSADWYDVRIEDYIAQLGVQRIIDDCHAGAAELCERIHRDEDGDIDTIENLYLNVAQARVTGMDLEASYQTPISLFTGSAEELSVRLFASFLAENSFSNVGAPKRDDAGTTHLPQWTATAVLGYVRGAFSTSLTGRYVDHRVQFSDPIAPASQLDDNTIDSAFYLSLRLGYVHAASAGKYRVFLNVANVLDADPPVVATWSDFHGASAFVPSLHDALGRRYTLGVELEF